MTLPTAAIQEQLGRVVASPTFRNSARLQELLRYTVTQALEGRSTSLKESVLGVTVFGRKPGYDSAAQSIVRVEFARLRKRLQQYYDAEGANDSWRILFPKGSYVPEFAPASDPDVVTGTGSSVVVLPFVCLSGVADDEYFADGLTDELITALTRVSGLRVVARTSSFTFKGRADDIRGIGTTLRVDAAIEGSLRRQGDLLRVHVQLVNVKDGCHLWAAKYERRLTDVFQLQEEIAAAIVSALKLELPRYRLTEPRIADPEAHALYLKGRFWWHRWNPEALRRAAGFFQHAVERDPTYAHAYAGLADCLFLQGFYGYGRPRDVMPRAQAYARRALEIDPWLCDGHCSLALLANAWEWDSQQCRAHFHRCLELNPNYAMAIAKFGTSYLSPLGRLDEAADWLHRALHLDPLSPLVHTDLALNFAYRGLTETFERESAGVLEGDPAAVRLHWFRTRTRGAIGDWRGVVESAECALQHMPEDPTTLGFAASAFICAGDRTRGEELRGKLEFLSQIRYVPFTALAFAHDVPGGADHYFRLMEHAVAERDPLLRVLRIVPKIQPFDSDTRFGALLKQIRLGDEDVAKAASINLAG